jgi:NHLM bacteriocin system ABC transporter ATP-binding protein
MTTLSPLRAIAPIDLGCAATVIPGTVRMITSGSAHVFAVQRKDGAAASPRRHLFTVKAPGVVMPVPEDPALGIITIPTPESRTEELSWEQFWKRARDPELGQRTLDAIEDWTAGWLEACAHLANNRPMRDLVIGSDPRADMPPLRILNADRHLVWLRVLSGEGVLLDTEPVGGHALSTVPLAGTAWLRSFDELHLRPVAAAELVRENEMQAVLEAFLTAAQRNLTLALNLAKIDAAARFDQRTGRLTADIDRLLGDLGRMVGAIGPQKAVSGSKQELLSAVHAVSMRIGVKAQLPTSVSADEIDQGASLERILEASSLRARKVTLADHWWQKSAGDFVAFRQDSGAPCALLDAGIQGYRLENPVRGQREAVTATIAATVSPHAFTLYQPFPDIKLSMRAMYLFGLQGAGADLLVILLAAIAGSWVASLPAIGSRLIFERLIPQHFGMLLIQVGVALALVAATRSVFSYANNVAFARIRGRASARLKAAIWDRILRQNMAFLSRYSAPDLTMRAATIENVVSAAHSLAHQSLITSWMLVINLGTLYWLAPAGAGAATGLIALMGLAILAAAWGQKRAFTLGEQAEGSVSTFVHALTNGIRKLRLAGAEERAFVKWGDRFSRSRMKLVHLRRVTNLFNSFAALFELLALAVVLAAVALLSPDPMKIGTFFGFIIAFQTCLSAMSALGKQVMNVAFQFASIPYAQPVLDAVPEREANKASPGRLTGNIEFSNVSFRYGADGAPILSSLAFCVQPGEFVALVGPTGCGKSTVVKLLLGLERPTGGAVLYDQRDLNGLDIDAVRRQIGAVLQRCQLTAGTIHEIIRGSSNATLDDTREAARLAGLGPDIAAMPMGLHTAVPEGQHGFSGGQLQRLSIARAIIRKPALLILDEATSALDNVTQAEITHNLAALACTRIVVAHRLSTVMGADRIIVLNEGRIVETGTYAELNAARGLFAAMAARQELS